MTMNPKLETMEPEELRNIALKLRLNEHSGKRNDIGMAGLSRLLDCTPQAVSLYCAGKRKIPPFMARMLREMVRSGRNPADFLRDTNKRYRPMVKVSEHHTLP